MKRPLTLIFLILMAAFSSAQDITPYAKRLVGALTPTLRQQMMFPLEDPERLNMNFVPMVRKGPTFHDFNEAQKNAALELLKISLSSAGYSKVVSTMELEKILAELEGDSKLPDGRARRDPLNYHFLIFGNPKPDGLWAWKFEGHHLSFNFVCDKGKLVSSTPSFIGSNPAIVKTGSEKGKQVLKLEMDLGFQLVNSLSESQLKEAKFSDDAPSEIITGNARKASALEPKGLRYTAMTSEQKDLFIKLLKVYVQNYQLGFSATLMRKIEAAGLDNLYFAWAGAMKPGGGQYYRIQGPMLLIEYDNTQNNANHVHTIVRDLTNDFAEDILKEHYEKDHN